MFLKGTNKVLITPEGVVSFLKTYDMCKSEGKTGSSSISQTVKAAVRV